MLSGQKWAVSPASFALHALSDGQGRCDISPAHSPLLRSPHHAACVLSPEVVPDSLQPHGL